MLVLTLSVFAAVLVIVIAAAAIYNRLVALRNRWSNAYAQIDVQLKRRYDLIPNLVEAVKGYFAHERQTLEAVIAARNSAAAANARAAGHPADGSAVTAIAVAESALQGHLSRFVGLAENYPDLKADQTVAALMEDLTTTENRVAFARQAFNDAAMNYNTARQSFPTLLIAGPLGFGPAEMFQIDNAAEREAVAVKL